jgi:zinc transport system substrate-binding protein
MTGLDKAGGGSHHLEERRIGVLRKRGLSVFGKGIQLCYGLAVGAVIGGSAPAAPPSSQPIQVEVSILPQKYFIERVGGDHVSVEVLVSPGQEPHTYDPTPKQMAHLAEAQIYFQIGFPFEQALISKIADNFQNLRVVDTRQGIKLRMQTEPDEDATSNPAGGKGEPDPHIWLSPRLVKIQAQNIATALVQFDPAHAAVYQKNLRDFQADLDRLDAELAATLAPFKGCEFFVFHPAFGYFADAYGLKQVPVEVGGKEPSAKELSKLIERAKNEGVKVIFVEPQFSPKSAQAVADAIGGAVVPLDPLAPNYIRNLENLAAQVQKALVKH